jgi:hypothetical protein
MHIFLRIIFKDFVPKEQLPSATAALMSAHKSLSAFPENSPYTYSSSHN